MPQYLTFTLDAQEYGVDILRVQEIRGYTPTTPVPGTPDYVCGVLNLRGTIIPVIDLRRRLGFPPADYGKFTAIVVLTIGTTLVGAIVDAVTDVVQCDEPPHPPPTFPGTVDARGITGLLHGEGSLVILLDFDALLAAPAMDTSAPADGPPA